MISKLKKIEESIGKTPLQKLDLKFANVYAKLEYFNFSGSIKDRAAFNIITRAVETGKINANTCVVESSSGNFAISLALMCRSLGLKFIAVIDPNINTDYEKCLRLLCHRVVKVSERDETGGFLLTRIRTVRNFCDEYPNIYWPNQYANPDNYLGYYNSLGVEILDAFSDLQYLFIGVSSGGTITGTSLRVKEGFPNVKIIAVDVEGSVIFGSPPAKRHISGIGSSQVPPILTHAKIDDVVHLSEAEIVDGCHALLQEQNIFGGASSGASYAAIKKVLGDKHTDEAMPTVLFLVPDRGNAYIDNVFDREWVQVIKSGKGVGALMK